MLNKRCQQVEVIDQWMPVVTRSLDDLLQACVDTHCLFGSACFVPESSFWLAKQASLQQV
ncbi:hypothetical protein [Vibrio anguillarum]|uniref:hypothetical protein n=1 Tax=Vibrio anguillarum TaxID=55601 RepID=UPI00188B35AA|nr:hypothetical protein [Vibrio anguillarum]